jgi:UDP-N-acetylmuramate dehydrogenase
MYAGLSGGAGDPCFLRRNTTFAGKHNDIFMMHIEENFSLQAHNTFRLDVKARWFIEYMSEPDLEKILSDEYFHSLPCLQLGGGSNVLFLNDSFPGIVLHSGMKGISTEDVNDGMVLLKAAAGELWDDVVNYAVSHGLYGIENLSGIPGEAGGAAVQNIGAYGVELSDVVDCVSGYEISTGKRRTFSRKECGYAYRTSIFKSASNNIILTNICLRLKRNGALHPYGNLGGETDNMTLARMRECILERRNTSLPHPSTLGNAGCYFVNPVVENTLAGELLEKFSGIPVYPMPDGRAKLSAAWMIESCGYKGARRGNVGISDRHALVPVNYGGATGQEIASLAEEVKEEVFARYGVKLQEEVIHV